MIDGSTGVERRDYGYTTWTFWPPKSETYLIEEIEKVWAGDMTVEEYLQGLQDIFDDRVRGRRRAHRSRRAALATVCRMPGVARHPALPPYLHAAGSRIIPCRPIRDIPFPVAGTTQAAPVATGDWRKKVVPWLFVLPILLINVVVVLGPALSAFYYSMTEWTGIGEAKWVGLENFRQLLFDDPSFWHAFRNNLIWLAMFLTIPIALALVAASLLAPIRRGALVYRMGLFLPYVLPSVVVAAIWRSLLHPDRGIPAHADRLGRPRVRQGIARRLVDGAADHRLRR